MTYKTIERTNSMVKKFNNTKNIPHSKETLIKIINVCHSIFTKIFDKGSVYNYEPYRNTCNFKDSTDLKLISSRRTFL